MQSETIEYPKLRADYQIPNLDHLEILEENRETDEAAWVKRRLGFVGSSNIATVMGVNSYQTPLELWLEYTQRREREPVGRAARYGRHAEKAILGLFAEDHPTISVVPNDKTFISKEYPFAGCTPDAFLIRFEELTLSTSQGIAECKHTAVPSREWFEGSAPPSAHTQTIWQMGITRREFAYIPAIVAGQAEERTEPYLSWDATADQIFADCLEAAYLFMQAVEQNIPPGARPGDKKAVESLIEERSGSVQLPDSLIEVYDRLVQDQEYVKHHKQLIKEPSERIDFYKTQLLEASGGAGLGLLSNGKKVVFKKVYNKGSTTAPYSYWNVTPK